MWFLPLLLAACTLEPAPCTSKLGANDADCDGLDDRDGDHDGDVSALLGGDDCDDANPDLNAADADGDGLTTCGGDCADDDDTIGARGVTPEVCDDVDNDCNGVVDVDDLGMSACEIAENYPIPSRLRLDLLVVIDNSGSMLDEVGRLPATGEALLARLAGTDTHLGIITDNTENLDTAGHLRPPTGSSDPWLSLLDTPDDKALTWWRNASDLGAGSQHPDAGLDAAWYALEVGRDTFNAGFYRPDADLAIWFVTDSDDASRLQDELEFETWLGNLKLGSGRIARVSGIVAVTGPSCAAPYSATSVYPTLIANTGGIAAPECELDWSPAVDSLAALEAPVTAIDLALSNTPIPATITVEVGTPDGLVDVLPYSAVVYEPFSNTVSVPQYHWGDVTSVVVRYEVLPPT